MLPKLKPLFIVLISLSLFACLSEEGDSDNDDDENFSSGGNTLTIVSASPAQGQRDIDVTEEINLTFNDDLTQNQASVSLTLSSTAGNVDGNLSISGRSVTYSPNQTLDYQTTYTVAIENNGGGDTQVQELTWSFVTESEPPPPQITAMVSSTSPADMENDVQPSRSITVSFDQDIASSDFDLSFSLEDQSSNQIAGTVTVSGSSATFNPDSTLSSETNYIATIGNNTGAQNVVQNYAWGFTTVAAGTSFCDSFYDSSFQLVEGMDNTAPTVYPKPAKGVETTDPAYGTCFVRATDHASEPPVGFARNDYSRRQAFNADDSMFVVYSNNGFWHVYDAITLAYIKSLDGPGGDAEIQWHPTDPNRLFYLPTNGGMIINSYDVSADQITRVADFNGRLPWSTAARVWTKSEGSPSANARYWGFQVETSGFSPLGLMTYDLETDTITGTWDFASNGAGRPDHVSMSPSGEYLVASWDNSDLGTTAFSRDFSQQVKVHTKSEHSDIALLPNGNDAYVAVDYQASGGDVFMVEIQTGVRTDLFRTYLSGTTTALHISGKNYNKPGWVLVSTYGGSLASAGRQWIHHKVFVTELAANPRIYNLMHHHASIGNYFGEPQASVNRDFTKILVNSNWGGAALDIDPYLLKLPPEAF